jgi:hypothetical protein
MAGSMHGKFILCKIDNKLKKITKYTENISGLM